MLYNRRTYNMKKTLLLFAALCFATLGFAQQPFATLPHNDSVQAFYGMNALQQAHAAAVDGDVINLSSGAFYSVNITKALTIRGQGMFNDDSIGLIRTRILNTFNVEVPDTVHRLTLIGLDFAPNANMNLRVANNPLFLKCRFQTVAHQTGTDYHTSNAVFINCIVGNWSNQTYTSSGTTYWYATGTTFYNSVILSQGAHDSPDILVNCIANQNVYTDAISNKTIMNSILYCSIMTNQTGNGYTSYNTIGINTYWTSSHGYRIYFDLTDMATHNLHNYTGYAQIFQTFNNNYSDGMSMALNDDIATTILGDDGTQVGIYGGQYPWDDKVSNPLIGHFSAARRTNTQGNLEVNIEVINE